MEFTSLKYSIFVFIFCLLGFIVFFDHSPIHYFINTIVMSLLVRLDQETFFIYKINFTDRKKRHNEISVNASDSNSFYICDEKHRKGFVGVIDSNVDDRIGYVDYLFIFSKKPIKTVVSYDDSRPLFPKLIGYKVFPYVPDKGSKSKQLRKLLKIKNRVLEIYDVYSYNSKTTKNQHKWVVNYIKRNFQKP